MSQQLTEQHDALVGGYFSRSAVEFDRFYDEQRGSIMRWVDRTFRFDMLDRFQRTFAALHPIEGKRILDVGCGSGPYIEEALRGGAGHVTGIDMAGQMIELANQRVREMQATDRCTLVTGAFPDGLPEGSFDSAIVMGVMDYVADPASFLSALANRVTDRAVLSFPSTHWVRTPLRKIRYRMKNCPLYFYDAGKIESLMVDAGFHSIDVEKIKGAGMDFVAVGHK